MVALGLPNPKNPTSKLLSVPNFRSVFSLSAKVYLECCLLYCLLLLRSLFEFMLEFTRLTPSGRSLSEKQKLSCILWARKAPLWLLSFDRALRLSLLNCESKESFNEFWSRLRLRLLYTSLVYFFDAILSVTLCWKAKYCSLFYWTS